MQGHWSQAHCGYAAFCGDGCVFVMGQAAWTAHYCWRKSDVERVHWPGWGNGTGNALPRVHPGPASSQWGPRQYKISYGLALESENMIFRNRFPLNETDPLTTWCGKDEGQVPAWGWQWESCGLQVSLWTFPPNWIDGKPWGWHHLPLFCTHPCAFREVSTPWKHVGSHSTTHHFPGEKVPQVSRTSFLVRVTLPGRIKQWWSLPTKAALMSYSFPERSMLFLPCALTEHHLRAHIIGTNVT